MESTVKVGVRIRPLLSKERHQNNSLANYDAQSIEFKNQTFTYDYVFGMDLPQQELYQDTAAPMLKSFLDGFNVTIIAYGQTGSGKTYTMGTADSDFNDPNSEGLIPRFVCDLFDNLENFSRNETTESNVKVSFLEIYGEDVYDLLGDTRAVDRLSLPVRESDNGSVFVQNLQELIVSSSGEALNALSSGSKNRITAATNMNAGSSRSHAVFTITLNQKMKSSNDEDMPTNITSKLTFVDLAGSERIKRTGAEGQRMKEGIQINSGLFNLGQVINGLADDHRLKQGAKPIHIPYRNSKLTHLLKDALGGNSQTLFLACVSPAESNESETYSTLSYARQARNIKNKPVRNMDKQQLELRRLRYEMKAWMTKAIIQMAQSGQEFNTKEIDQLMSNLSNDTLDMNSEIFQRPDVLNYISTVNEKVDALVLGGSQPSPRKYRMSIVSPRIRRSIGLTTKSFGLPQKKLHFNDDDQPSSITDQAKYIADRRRSLSGITEDDKGEEFQSPEEAEELVTRMMELVHKEKELNKDGASSDEGESDKEEMEEVDREINEKEEILLKLKEAVKGFGAMKQEYEALLSSIHSLELERNELEIALEKAAKKSQQSDKTSATAGAGAGAVNPLAMEKLQERYHRVKEELEKMKNDKNKKESAYRLIQTETKRCENLTKEITKLKEMKVKLQQTQRLQQQQHLKFKKEQNLKMGILKKCDVKRQKQMNELKSELQKKVRVLGNKDREILRITSKLKAAEEHINQLIRLNNNRRQKLITTGTSRGAEDLGNVVGNSTGNALETMSKETQQLLHSSKNILENLVHDKIEMKYNKKLLNKKLLLLREMREEMNETMGMVKELEKKKVELGGGEENGLMEENENEELSEVMSSLKSYEGNLNELTAEMNVLNEDIADLTRQLGDGKELSESSWDNISRGVIASLSLSQSQLLLWEYLQNKAELTDGLREAKDRCEEIQELYENSQDKIRILQGEVETLQSDMKHISTAAEKQRVNDLWTLLKTQSDPTVSASSPSSGPSAASVAMTKEIENNPSLQSIAFQRAQELECALSESLATEEEYKTEIYDLRYQNKELLKKLQEKIKLEQIAMACRKDSRHGRVGEDQEDGEESGVGNLQKKLKEEISQRYGELDSLWGTLGTSVGDREKTLDLIDNASQLALQQALEEARAQHSQYANEEGSLQRKYDLYINLMQLPRTDTSTDATDESLIHRTEELRQKLTPLVQEFQCRCEKVKKIAVKLRKVVEEMEYESTTLPIELQILLKMDLQYISLPSGGMTLDHMASYCFSHKIPFTSAALSFMESKLLELSLECSQNISRITELLQSLTPLRNRLGFKTPEDFIQLTNEASPSAERAIDLLLNHKVKIIGSGKILSYLENVLFILISLKTNRETCVKNLQQFVTAIDQYFQIQMVSSALLSLPSPSQTRSRSCSEEDSGQGSGCNGEEIDIINRSYITEFIRQMNQFPTLMDSHLDTSQLGLYAQAADLGISSEEYEPRMNMIANTPPQSPEELRMYSEITNPMKALEGIVPFVDEPWLKRDIEDILVLWNERSNDANFAIVLLTEKNRMAKYADLLYEIKRQDSLLLQHITDMETFEITSKQNRQKVLMGNSKALVDEEKFRKSGKKKFEVISEKLLDAARAAQACSAGFPLDISRLSSSGQDLLRGKIHERTELMHLHTMTHGAKRWSGELEASSSHEDHHHQNENLVPGSLLNHVSSQAMESNQHGTVNPTPGKKAQLANKKGLGAKKEPSSRSHPTTTR